jgi:UDP-GlcNAc:undecaprenyl-phosphate GlcNAc-1-phosphate transferase
MIAYALVLGVAALIAHTATPAVVAIARRIGAVDIPDDRKVHAVPTPTLGGTAIFLGFSGGFAVAWALPTFRDSFRTVSIWPPSELVGIAAGTAIIFALGVIDDLKGLRAPAKLSGQLLAAGIVFLSGVRLYYFRFPFVGPVSLSSDLSAIATIGWIVVIVNAVNLIDGLDGLAAGITAIAAGTFFIYSYQLAERGLAGPEQSAPLISVVIVGATLGFLRYNFNPARIFMGDSGSMTLGFLLAAATTVGVGRSAPANDIPESVLFYLPLIIPVIVLAIPILDTSLAIVRRARRGSHIFVADKEHLHHRLLEIGHGHRQAVLILYAWTAVIAGAGLALSFVPDPAITLLFLGAGAAVLIYTMLPRLVRPSSRSRL